MSCSKERLEQFLNDGDLVYIVSEYDSQASEHFCAEVRCKVDGNDYSDFCSEFVRKFSSFSHTIWIVRRTFPQLQRLAYRKVYVCHHNSHNKQKPENSKKNKECGANIDFKIKLMNRNTMKNDEYLKQGFNAIITISFSHTHPVEIAEAFRFLKCDSEVESQFLNYFDSGMTPSAAKEYHEIQLCTDNCDPQLLANGQLNPSMDHVNYLFTKWRKNKYGDRSETTVHDSILQKKEKLEEKGFTIVYKEQPRIIIILSPIMKRAYSEGLASEILFVDTTSACDQENTCITFMFTANKAGGIPIACILHTQQTEADYTLAFSLTKEALQNEYPHTRFEPGVIMTDDSAAERNALKTIFPSSRLLLCSFHVNQAFWRWLWSNDHGVGKEERQTAMTHFREILYSVTIEEAQKKYDDIREKPEVKRNEKLLNHLDNLWKRRTEWCLAYRNDVITRGHNTNNYTEASIRVLKDIILQRCKVFNVCALLEFITTVFENYHQRRLLAFADGRKTNTSVYSNFQKKDEKFQKNTVTDTQIQIMSNREPDSFYTVHTDTATCDCIFGRSGKYCKHMYHIEAETGTIFKTSPLLSVEDRILFAKLALGNNIKEDFYRNMSDICIQNPSTSSEKAPSSYTLNSSAPMDIDSVSNIDDTQTDRFKKEFGESLSKLQDAFSNFSNVLYNNPNFTSLNCMKRMTKLFESAQTTEKAYELVLNKFPRRVTRKIKVQPTSVSRRKDKGAGRKSKNRISAGKPPKKIHSLSKNISKNVPNAR